MDDTALYKLTYGVFMLSTRLDDKANGCIIDTCIQVANSPIRVAISAMNTNYTCELLKESKAFAISVLDEKCDIETIKHWGFSSGRNVNKMEGLNLQEDVNGVPYLSNNVCAILSCKVLDMKDLGSHTLFIAEVIDALKINNNNPLTYADYQKKLKLI